jgi:multidrug resistance efflux pump
MVTSEFIDVAAPIEGMLHRERVEPGTILPPDRLLATISNPRIDKTTLSELQASLDSLDGEVKALRSVIGTLRALGGKFQSRGKAYQARRAAQLSLLLGQSQARLEADRARAGASEARSRRALEMSKVGVGSAQNAEEAERDAAVAAKTLIATQHEHDSLAATLSALKEGISLSESSSMDRSYSSQRVDEITLRFTQLEGTLTEKEARRAALESQLAAQQSQVALLSEARLTAPRRARVWSLTAGEGVYVSRGAPLMRLLDCSGLRVLAYLGEFGYNRIRVGDRADVTLLPDGARYAATVDLRLGGPDARLPAQSALSTAPDQRERYAVVVSSPELSAALGQRCESGQNVEVLFHPEGR